MKFLIEQIAIYPADPKAAQELLEAIGAVDWIEDNNVAEGHVFGGEARNTGELKFNYQLHAPGQQVEFELLHYVEGDHWMDGRQPSVCHLGMHCSAEALEKWREFFAARDIGIAQAVDTVSHSNPAIAGKRRYRYVVFNTRPILGVDLKFIVRLAP